MDDRKSVQILGIRFGRDNVIVIRDKFGVYAGFFRNGYDVFQSSVLVDPESDGDLVVGIIGDDGFQVVNVSDDVYVTIGFSIPFAVV